MPPTQTNGLQRRSAQDDTADIEPIKLKNRANSSKINNFYKLIPTVLATFLFTRVMDSKTKKLSDLTGLFERQFTKLPANYAVHPLLQ